MRILMHFMFPDSGKAEILGHNTNTEASAVHEQVAFVAEDPVFYDSLTVAENIRYGTGSLLRGKTHAQRKILLETFALDPKAMGWELSRRERAKLSVVIALLRNPPIFLLDSPFTYLAPVERSNLLKHLHAQKKRVPPFCWPPPAKKICWVCATALRFCRTVFCTNPASLKRIWKTRAYL